MRGYTIHPDNYNRLITAALDLPSATFITLNYDTLLDRRLFAYAPLTSMDSYVDPARNWSLIKLHGSVDWGYRVLSGWRSRSDDRYSASTFSALGDDLVVDEEIALTLAADVETARRRGSDSDLGGELFYPALSAPLGPGDELVCPDNHVDHLRDRLRQFDGLHLLVIGYSGLDQEVVKLFHESENTLRSITIVSNTKAAAEQTMAAIVSPAGIGRGAGSFDFLDPVLHVEGGFDQYARSGDLQRRIESLP